MWKVQTLSSFFFVNIRESLEILGISRIFSRKYRAFFRITISALQTGWWTAGTATAASTPPAGRASCVSTSPTRWTSSSGQSASSCHDDLEINGGDDGRKPPPPPGAGFFSQVRFLIEGDKSVQSYSKPESYDERRAAVIRGRLVVLSAMISNTW